jgi:short-subunit dehydrogenase
MKQERSWKQAALLAGAGVGLALAGRELYGRWREADLRGQVALITGGSRGLGFLLAWEFARQGCRIAICARDEEELAEAQAELAAGGAEVLTLTCDVTDRAQVARMVQLATGRFGGVDILVNNAGIIEVGPAQAMEVADYEKTMAVIFWGTLYPTLAVLPQMLERRGGRVVNITSIGGKVSVPHLLPYNCAKFAAVGFSEGLRAELAKDGVVVVTIAPGLMRTGGHVNARFKGRHEQEYAWFSLGASLPFISMDAERAARRIVRAAKRGESEVTLSVPANALALFHGLFPGTTADILGLVNRLLPAGEGPESGSEPGREVQERVRSRLLETLTTLGRSAAERYQHGAARTSARE